MILTEFDPKKDAVINPWTIHKKVDGMPKIAVSCFSVITLQRLCEELNAVKFAVMSNANMDIPIYKAKYKGKEFALFMMSVGAPGCISCLEDLYVMGVEKFVIFGNCGVLNKEIEDCSIIIPTSAMRDEGTSFHYAPASDEIEVNKKYIKEFVDVLNEYNCSYSMGKTWTTDAFYRETVDKVQKRKESGCICVDMECSAVAAWADFREKEVFQFFYAGDNLDKEEWDARSLNKESNLLEKDRVAVLAMEMAVKMDFN